MTSRQGTGASPYRSSRSAVPSTDDLSPRRQPQDNIRGVPGTHNNGASFSHNNHPNGEGPRENAHFRAVFRPKRPVCSRRATVYSLRKCHSGHTTHLDVRKSSVQRPCNCRHPSGSHPTEENQGRASWPAPGNALSSASGRPPARLRSPKSRPPLSSDLAPYLTAPSTAFSFFSLSNSVTRTSVVSISPAMLAAFSSAVRVTLVGSMMPALNMSTNVPEMTS